MFYSTKHNCLHSQAFDTHHALTSQRSTLSGSSVGIQGLTGNRLFLQATIYLDLILINTIKFPVNMPSINRLIDGIQSKKYKESLIVAIVVGILICFTLW